ncbi:MAG: tyrosine-protein phosphatase [Vulcanimicrobiota bacterium]
MHLDWPGARNTRYLSGLPAGQFVVKDLIRSDSPDQVEAEHLRRQGVTTIIDLRNPDERAGLRHFSLHLPLDGVEDREFWSEWGQKVEFGTPLYYAPHLSRMPERSARVLSAMAAAPPGTLLFHCVIGRDRTGMIAMLLLSHLGVEPEVIVEDYLHSVRNLPPEPRVESFFQERNTSLRQTTLEVIEKIGKLRLVEPDQLRRRFLH